MESLFHAVVGWTSAITPTTSSVATTAPLADLLEVALPDVGPEPLVHAEAGQHDQRQRHDPPDRVRRTDVRTCALRPVRRKTVEAQPEGEQVGKCDQATVQDELQKRVSVDGQGRGADPSAHRGRFY